jgi:DNA topoisomerase-2
VYLNGEKLPVKAFQDYCELYLGPKDGGVPRVYERVNDRWGPALGCGGGRL